MSEPTRHCCYKCGNQVRKRGSRCYACSRGRPAPAACARGCGRNTASASGVCKACAKSGATGNPATRPSNQRMVRGVLLTGEAMMTPADSIERRRRIEAYSLYYHRHPKRHLDGWAAYNRALAEYEGLTGDLGPFVREKELPAEKAVPRTLAEADRRWGWLDEDELPQPGNEAEAAEAA